MNLEFGPSNSSIHDIRNNCDLKNLDIVYTKF